MRLTRKQAIDLSIELWKWLAETGKQKEDWPGWEELGGMGNHCPLCEYAGLKNRVYKGCSKCPLSWGEHGCQENPISYYDSWRSVLTKKAKKKYAKLFLEQLKELKK